MLIVGATLSLAGAIGLFALAGVTIHSFQILAWPIDAPLPQPRLMTPALPIAGPLLFAAGMALVTCGLVSYLNQHEFSGLERLAFVVAAVGTSIASALIGWSLLQQRHCFAEIASSAVRPDFERLGMRMKHAGSLANFGGGSLIAMQGVVLLVGFVLLKRKPVAHSRIGKWPVITAGLLATSFACLSCWAWWQCNTGLWVMAASGYSAPQAIAAVMEATTTYLFAAATAIVLYGLQQLALIAFLSRKSSLMN